MLKQYRVPNIYLMLLLSHQIKVFGKMCVKPKPNFKRLGGKQNKDSQMFSVKSNNCNPFLTRADEPLSIQCSTTVDNAGPILNQIHVAACL